MGGNDRYDVMRRSSAHVNTATIASSAGVTVAQRKRNRVALLIAVFDTTGAGDTNAFARPAEVTGSTFGIPIFHGDLDAATVFKFTHHVLDLNIWDHGDMVNMEWEVGTSGGSLSVMTIEVIDPEVK